MLLRLIDSAIRFSPLRFTVVLCLVVTVAYSVQAEDYYTVDEMYSYCTSSQDKKVSICHAYVEGVAATFTSLAVDQLPQAQQQELREKLRGTLHSGRIVNKFVELHEEGRFVDSSKGASYYVVASIIEIARSHQ